MVDGPAILRPALLLGDFATGDNLKVKIFKECSKSDVMWAETTARPKKTSWGVFSGKRRLPVF